jgi:hypothetical protein
MDLPTGKMNRDYYRKKIEENTVVLDGVKSRLRVIPYLKLLFFLAGVSLAVAAFRLEWDRTACLAVSALSFVIFFLLYKRDEYYLQKKAYHEALNSVYAGEISFLNGDYRPFDNGERFIDKKHPYSYDMDVFGENSIYHMMNRTVTQEAASILAGKLPPQGKRPQEKTKVSGKGLPSSVISPHPAPLYSPLFSFCNNSRSFFRLVNPYKLFY